MIMSLSALYTAGDQDGCIMYDMLSQEVGHALCTAKNNLKNMQHAREHDNLL